MIENVILIRYGEIHLKGKNRPFFDKKLMRAIREALRGFDAKLERGQGRYYITEYSAMYEEQIMECLSYVFGIHSYSAARACEKEWDTIASVACGLMQNEIERLGGQATFKVFPKRSDKLFAKTSNEIASDMGGVILQNVPGTRVDVRNPQIALGVEIREKAYVYAGERMGQGGMPIGSNGKVTLLLSGGIDSPVAGHMMMKRGLSINCVHFHSFPYTSEHAKEKVVSLTRTLSRYCGAIRLFVVPFTELQMVIYDQCPSSQTTIIMRRAMMQIAEKIAMRTGSQALVTGEAVGQVASQTIESLTCTQDAVSLPVFRPVIGFDKNEIIERAKVIDTFETSILPYEDCCTIFTPKHPVTHPNLAEIRKSQDLLDNWDDLIHKAVDGAESILVSENLQCS